MRLIEADTLVKDLLEQIPLAENVTIFKDIIESQPTAYDVDKVVEYLEQLRDRFNKKDFAIRGIIEKAIEVVKAGYVNKQTNK